MATVVFKPTEACNSRCSYCDVVRKKPLGPVTMPLETLELFFIRINDFLVERHQERIEIIWHGGEPLLLGPDYFEQACRFQEEFSRPRYDYWDCRLPGAPFPMRYTP